MSKKVYARQVPPDCQQSPLVWGDEYPDGVIFDGNRHYNSRKTPEYERLMGSIESVAYDVADIINKVYCTYTTVTEAIHDSLYPAHKEKYTTREIKMWKDILYDYLNNARCNKRHIYCQALSLMTGKVYAHATITGCCQSDWQEIYYPVEEYGENFVTNLGISYFNTGSEWCISDSGIEPENPDDIDGFYAYCYSWSDDDIRSEIAGHCGADPKDVVLYKFDKYMHLPVYSVA